MDSANGHKAFLARYQSLVLNQKLENGAARDKADLARKTMAHLQYAKLSGLVSSNDINGVRSQYEDMYVNIVDSFDEQTGLNNYAEGALSICSGNKNESQSWKSSLTLAKIKTLSCVQKAIADSKEMHGKLVINHKLSDPLPHSKKENHPPSLHTQHPPQIHDASQSQVHNTRNETDNQSADKVNSYVSHARENHSCLTATSSVENNMPNGAVPNYVQNELHNRPASGSGPRYNHGNFEDNLPASRVGVNYIPREEDDRGRSNRQPLFSSEKPQVFNQYGGNQGNRNVRESYGCKRNLTETEETYEDERACKSTNIFRTAKQQMDINIQKKYGGGVQIRGPVNTSSYGTGKKSLGTRRGFSSKFVPPVMSREDEDFGNQAANTITRAVLKTGGSDRLGGASMEGLDDERLKGIEPKMVELITNEIMDNGPSMSWDDVAGLEFAKKSIKEIVVWPMLRPDIFTGLRGPPKGLLLFGPPGTGKTLIGKCIASQSKSTFFCISASSLTSKWVGEGEKMVRALFAVARSRQPAVVFIDEIDSLLTQRTDGENEASRRIKTEFLVQLDGASTNCEDRLLVIGATNRPQEIDEAARRRFVKRLYIPLPECPARRTIITNLLHQQSYQLSDPELDTICVRTEGFSGADMATLCREAALGPIRDMSFGDIENMSADQVRSISYQDFEEALRNVRPSVSDKDLDIYIDWNNTFGSGHR